MKKIGREVLFLATDENNPRNGEGAFIRLKDGSILYAFTEYSGGDRGDHSHANISSVVSYDEGETWSARKRLVTADEGAANVMSVSFLRMKNGDIGLFYLRKDALTRSCLMYVRRSSDEGKTWSDAICCMDSEGYYVVNNDRIIRLQSGRILLPFNYHGIMDEAGRLQKGEMNFMASDDDGYTWKRLLPENVKILAEEKSSTGLQETGIYQQEDGTIRAWSRTKFGSQYECFSKDDGASWSVPQPSEFFTSPDSPMQMKRVGKYTVAVWNPIPNYTGRAMEGTGGRTPYVCAVSEDDGKTFPKLFYIEDDLSNGYCYPAILEGDDYFLVAYYHSNNSGYCLNCNKIVKVMLEEL